MKHTIFGNSAQVLQAFVQRIEQISAKIDELNMEKSRVYVEARAAGFDSDVLKRLIDRRRKGKALVNKFDTTLSLYEKAVGSLPPGVDMGPETSLPSDEEFAEAKEVIRRKGYCSISLLQNTMSIPYNKAAGLVARLEAANLVTKPDETGKRKLVI